VRGKSFLIKNLNSRFITLAGFHTNNFSVFDLARNYKERGMAAYSELQEKEFAAEKCPF